MHRLPPIISALAPDGATRIDGLRHLDGRFAIRIGTDGTPGRNEAASDHLLFTADGGERRYWCRAWQTGDTAPVPVCLTIDASASRLIQLAQGFGFGVTRRDAENTVALAASIWLIGMGRLGRALNLPDLIVRAIEAVDVVDILPARIAHRQTRTGPPGLWFGDPIPTRTALAEALMHAGYTAGE